MNPDDPVCLCFHVSRRKVVNFIRIEKPRRPSQLSECFGAGTGCGWCRPYLVRILNEELSSVNAVFNGHVELIHSGEGDPNEGDANEGDARFEDLSPDEYARRRSKYVRRGGGTPPPGATPLEPESC